MVDKDSLYEAFGELIYAVAKADGLIQKEEIAALDKVLKGHPWASEIKWSFDYEMKKDNDLEDAYHKALYTCQEYGPCEDYKYLMEVIEAVAKASEGVSEEESIVKKSFEMDLRNRFLKDLEAQELI